ncbi:FAD-binding domain-containing protein [Aspergillus varians]
MQFSSTVFLGVCLSLRAVLAAPVDYPYSVFTNSSNAWDVGTTINFPNTTAFDDATERWNNANPPVFAVAITPATEEDVARAVAIARSIDLPFLATGGRHSTSITLQDLQQGLAIDLSALNSVQVDDEAGTLTVGGGTIFSEIYDDVYAAGYQMPVGTCSCPGMVGVTAGGGIGRFQGVNGLLIDSLLSVRLVTANSEIIDVSEDSNSDLFWAIRGAAPNFGVITSATYKLHPLINDGQFMSADFIFPASSNASYFDFLETLEGTIPAELSAISVLGYNETTDETQIVSNWVYLGSEERGREIIAPLLDLNPTYIHINTVPYNVLPHVALLGLGATICSPVSIAGYGVNYRNLSSSTYQDVFQTTTDFWAEYPDGRTSTVEIELFAPQAVEAVPAEAAPYPWRDTLGFSIISFAWETPETRQAGEETGLAIRAAFAETSGYDGLRVYVSYGHGDETLSQLLGDNVPRLVELKSVWDPDNVFGFFHGLFTTPV